MNARVKDIPLYKMVLSALIGLLVYFAYAYDPGASLGLITAIMLIMYAGYESYQISEDKT